MLSRSYRSPAREVMFTPTSIRASGRISETVFTLNTLLSKVPIVSPYNGSLRVPSVGHIEPSGSSMRMLLRTQSIVLPSTEAGNSAGSRFAKSIALNLIPFSSGSSAMRKDCSMTPPTVVEAPQSVGPGWITRLQTHVPEPAGFSLKSRMRKLSWSMVRSSFSGRPRVPGADTPPGTATVNLTLPAGGDSGPSK